MYLREIILDYNHFNDSFKHADLELNINGINLEDITDQIINRLNVVDGIAF